MAILNQSGDLVAPSASELDEADADNEMYTLTIGTTDDGKPYWMYAAIVPSLYQDFIAAAAAGQRIEINDYGYALKFGFDAVPPAEVKEEMKRKYGFDENYEAKLAAEIEKERKAFLERQEDERIKAYLAPKKDSGGNTNESQS
jgi:hypothetical protein